jgi:hypothetical protein
MTSGVVKYVTTLICATAVVLLVFGLAVRAQQYWEHSWIVCVITLLLCLVCLLFSRDSDFFQLGMGKVFRPYRARRAARQGQTQSMSNRSVGNPYINRGNRPNKKYLAHGAAVSVQKRRKTDRILSKKDRSASRVSMRV